MHIFRRLWETARNRKTHRPSGQKQAGRFAEVQTARRLADEFSDAPIDIWGGLRIPDVGTGRLREIDFVIACGSDLATLELKNWVGRVEQNDERILQHRSGRGGGHVVDHGDLFQRLDARVESLEAYLDDRGITTTEIRSFLVFSNPDIIVEGSLEPEGHQIFIAADPGAEARRAGGPAGPSAGNAPSVANSTHQVVEEAFADKLDSPAGSEQTGNAIQEALDDAGTWDRLSLYGGRHVTGDIDWIVDDEHALSDRATITEVQVDVSRSYIEALTSAPSLDLEIRRRDGEYRHHDDVSLGDVVRFRPAGESEMTDIELRHLEHITYGARRNLESTLGWNDLETGERYFGRVSGIVDFGIFVDLGAPTDGLVHISNIDRRRHTDAHELPRRFSGGDLVDIRVTDINREDEEISLVLIHHPADP